MMLAGLAGLVLFAPDDGTGNGPEPKPSEIDPTDPTPPAKTFTQDEVNALIGKRIKSEQSKFESDLKSLKERGDLDEVARLKAELADKDTAIAASDRKVLESRLETTAERAALTAGANPARVAKFLRTFDLDLDSLTDDGKIDADAVKALVESELNDSPEFKSEGAPKPANDGKPTGGDFTGANNSAKQWTRAEIAKLTPAEFDEHEAEISKQVAAGTVK